MPSPRNRYTLVRRISVLQGNEFAEVVGGGVYLCDSHNSTPSDSLFQ